MKHRMSISVDEETILQMRDCMRNGTFRNKSHFVEHAIQEFLRRE